MPTRIPRFSTVILIIACLLLSQGAGSVRLLLAETEATEAASYYVAASGRPTGDGSIGNPWDLQTALGGRTSVGPGDTIWLRGGTYRGTFLSNLNGTPSAPIKVRQYPGERATLDGGNSNHVNILTVSGSYTWYWGFEITSSDPNRVSNQTGSNPSDVGRGGGVAVDQTSATGAGLKFINLVVHDTAGGFGLWKEAVDAEIYGCVVYYNGWTGPDHGHGHGIYGQNLTGTKRVVDNIVFSNFSHGIQVFGSGAAFLDNITVQGNTFFDNGMPNDYQRNILVGGGSIAQNPRIIDNVLYYPGNAGQNLNVGYDYGVGAADPVITGNYIVNGDNYFSPLNTNVTMTGNAFYSTVNGAVATLYPSNTYSTSRPTTPRIFVRPNQYEPGRANITVVNWGGASTVSVDLSSVLAPGATYEIRNAQNFFAAPVVKGTSDGSLISLPMTSLLAAVPAGFGTPRASGPAFNVFILLSDPAPAPRLPPTVRRSPRPAGD